MTGTRDHDTPETLLAALAADLIRSGGARSLAAGVIREILDEWSAKGPVRRAAAGPLKKVVSRLAAVRGARPRPIGPALGRLMSAWAKKVNAEHATDPCCHASHRGAAAEAFLRNTDFGEIKEMLETSRRCVEKTLEAVSDALWKYPAKVGSILGSLVASLNTAVTSLVVLLKPIDSRVGPDLLADMVLSLLRNIDAKATGDLANLTCEIVRRLHTGNLLLARAGRPLFQVYLTELLEEFFSRLDASLLTKARVAFAQDREAFESAVADALAKRPDLILDRVASLGSTKTPLVRAISRKTRLFDELDRDDLGEALSRGLSDLDMYEVAQAVNTIARVVNDLHEARPGMFSQLLHLVADSLDTPEVRRALGWITSELKEAFGDLVEAQSDRPSAALSGTAGGGA